MFSRTAQSLLLQSVKCRRVEKGEKGNSEKTEEAMSGPGKEDLVPRTPKEREKPAPCLLAFGVTICLAACPRIRNYCHVDMRGPVVVL
jgi:hypothetical protein